VVFAIAFQALLKPVTILVMAILIDWVAARLSGADRDGSAYEDV